LPEPPHMEDCEINTEYKPKLIRNLSENESKRFLEEILDESVKVRYMIYRLRVLPLESIAMIKCLKGKKLIKSTTTSKRYLIMVICFSGLDYQDVGKNFTGFWCLACTHSRIIQFKLQLSAYSAVQK
jgi:hypothetical protein